jgi:5'-nucleotidase / UDP-sugar diphosphatase
MRASQSGSRWLSIALCMLCLSTPASPQTHLRILFTHDLHSTLLPLTIAAPDGRHVQSGGFARLASAIREAAAANPLGTLTVDGGDFTMGTLFHTLYLTESPELRLMGMMGYDVTMPGNHDFDFHLGGLAGYLNNAYGKSAPRLPAIVMSNLDLTSGSPTVDSLLRSFKNYGVREVAVFERKGIRFGVFGVMGKDAADDSPFLEGATFEEQIPAAHRCVQLLKDSAKADIVLCLSHSGTSGDTNEGEDIDLAREVPGIDIIISGHSHRTLQQPLSVGNTIICSAGAFGAYLGILDVGISPPGRLCIEHYALLPIDSTVTGDTIIAGAIKDFAALVDRNVLAPSGLTADRVLAESGFDFESLDHAYAHPGELGLGDLVADAYRYSVVQAERPDAPHIDAVIVPIGMIRSSILRGPLTVGDVFRVLSLGLGPDKQPGYPLITACVTGADLRNTLEIETTVASLKEDAHLQFAGVRFRFNRCRIPLNRVTDAEVFDSTGQAHPIDDDRLYRVCICLYSGIMLTSVSSLSHDLITIRLRRRDGTIITDWNETLVDADTVRPGTQELKAWVALMHYLQSFPPGDHDTLPQVPARYRMPAGRFTADASLNPTELVRNPNRFTIAAVLLAALMLLGLSWTVTRLIRGSRSR